MTLGFRSHMDLGSKTLTLVILKDYQGTIKHMKSRLRTETELDREPITKRREGSRKLEENRLKSTRVKVFHDILFITLNHHLLY